MRGGSEPERQFVPRGTAAAGRVPADVGAGIPLALVNPRPQPVTGTPSSAVIAAIGIVLLVGAGLLVADVQDPSH